MHCVFSVLIQMRRYSSWTSLQGCRRKYCWSLSRVLSKSCLQLMGPPKWRQKNTFPLR